MVGGEAVGIMVEIRTNSIYEIIAAYDIPIP